MTNRREFIQQGVALSAAPFVLRPVVGVTAQTERLSPVLAIFDHQYVESRFFASALATRGVPTQGINGDVTALWYNDLYHRWAAGPSPIVGLTGASSLFCLEQLAWAVERRVVFRAEHRQLADDGIEHRLTGPEPHPASRDIDSNWPLWSATVVQTLPARLRRGVKFDARAVGSAHPESAVWEEPLVTWVIAPKPVGYAPS